MEKLIVIGSGSGRADNLTMRSLNALQNADSVLVSTSRIPIWRKLQELGISATALDSCYEQAEDFDQLNNEIYKKLKEQAGVVAYVVYGSALDNQAAAYVVDTAKKEGIAVEVIPGTALADTAAAAWNYFGNKYVFAALEAAALTFDIRKAYIITEIDSKLLAGELKCQLLEQYNGDTLVDYYIEDDNGHGKTLKFQLAELDRQKEDLYNHTACLLLKPVEFMQAYKYDFEHLLEIMRVLRGVNGCPWDREQDHKSLERYLIEEAYEAVEAIRQEDPEKLYDELGDVLLQVVFHGQIGSEHGEFDTGDIINAICRKMIKRHPHVFADTEVENSNEVLKNWEAIKRQEKQLKSYGQVMEDVPKSMPALMRAFKIGQKAAQVAFDWPNAKEAAVKLGEEIQEFRSALDHMDADNIAEEMGDLLFSMVNTARLAGVQPEIALNRAVDKFIARFSAMEDKIKKSGNNIQEMNLDEMDVFWEMVKKEEN